MKNVTKRVLSLILSVTLAFPGTLLFAGSVFAEGYEPLLLGDNEILLEQSEEVSLSFTPEIDGYYRFFSTSDGDPYVNIFNSEFSCLCGDDDSGTDYNFSVKHYLEAGQTYIVSIGNYSPFSFLCTVTAKPSKALTGLEITSMPDNTECIPGISEPDYSGLEMTAKWSDGTETYWSWNADGDMLGDEALYFNTDPLSENGTVVIWCGEVNVTVEFTVLENPIAAITAEPVTVIENTNGYFTNEWDDDTGKLVEFYRYNANLGNITVTMKNGNVYSGEPYEVICEINEAEGLNLDTGYSTYSDQSPSAPWGIGEHTAVSELAGIEVEHRIIITESPVESVTADDVTVTENTNGYYDEDWDDVACDYVQYYRYYAGLGIVTVTMKNGNVYSGGMHEVIDGINSAEGLELSHEYSLYTGQSPSNPWGIGEHTVSCEWAGIEFEYRVTITKSPIASITADEVSFTENTNGYPTEYWDDVTESTVTYYRYAETPDCVTVTLKNGNVYNGYYYEVIEEINEAEGLELDPDSLTVRSDQAFENQWGVGRHTVYCELTGVEFEFCVNITETPIASVTADDVNIIENTNGNYVEEWDDVTESVASYFRYYVFSQNITVTMKNGSVYSGEPYEVISEINEAEGLELNYNFQLFTDQSPSAPWGAGEHTVHCLIAGAECDYRIIIAESPIASITADAVTFVEGTNVYPAEGWDGKTGTFVEYNRYSENPDNITVTLKNGSVYSGYWYDVIERINAVENLDLNPYTLVAYSDQSYENQWSVGEHTVTAALCGTSFSLTIRIVADPVLSIVFDDVEVYEGNGYSRRDVNYETGETSDYYMYYYPVPGNVTVTLKNGSVYSGTFKDVFTEVNKVTGLCIYTDAYLGVISDQSFEKQWQAGNTYPCTVDVGCGYIGTVNVTVSANPIASVSASDVKLYECLDGTLSHDPYGNEYVNYFEAVPEEITVTMKDGTVYSGAFEEVAERLIKVMGGGIVIDCIYEEYDQSYGHEWKAGSHHKAMLSCGGVSCEYDVEIVENPVLSIEAEDTFILDTELAEIVSEHNAYIDEVNSHGGFIGVGISTESFYAPGKITVTMKNGSVYTGTVEQVVQVLRENEGIILEDGTDYYWYNENFYNPTVYYKLLEKGAYECEFYVGAMKTLYNFNVVSKSGEHVHTYKTVVTPATCTTDGYTTHTCSGCGDVYTDNVVPAKGHVPSEAYECDGENHRKVCTVCEEKLEAAPHTFGDDGACDICGYSAGTARFPGDANEDGKVNVGDVTAMLKFIAKWDIKINESNAEVTGDGKVNVTDVTLLLKYLAKWDVVLK